ncbi:MULTISPECIES: YbjN domain-containing protein [unclassified Actinotalea]|uniref:YbjN domain-containing protein n=1 Tax=unclassified Actinotalea TaxID=2638618 RepID=UPI0015F63549|nr:MULTISPECIES: YbjN domain-containing protein [unclassified Actinotalea]
MRARRRDEAPGPESGRGPSRLTQRPRPLDSARVEAYLVGEGYHVHRDEDDDLTGTWDGDRFWFLLLGEDHEVLQVRGRWHRTLPEHRRAAALLAVNDWNRERIWPKAYVRAEDGELALYGEVSVDLEHGVTDDQLAQLVACGLGTGVQLFAALGQLVPPQD